MSVRIGPSHAQTVALAGEKRLKATEGAPVLARRVAVACAALRISGKPDAQPSAPIYGENAPSG